MAMGVTVEMRDELVAAMAKGAKTLMQGGEMIVFDSFEEMQKRIDWMNRQLGETTQKTRRVHYPTTGTGFRT